MTNKIPAAPEVEEVEQPTFDILPLSKEVRKAVDELGYTHPTPVQKAVFASASAGRDVVVQARTGTGKTAAFGLPVVDRLVDQSKNEPQILILSPTRELALQINRELEGLSKYKDVTCTAVYGGAPMQPQINAIQGGTQVIAGTPGRVLDHLERGTLDPSSIVGLVLDEADEMLSMGFLPQITKIMEQLPKKHQTLLFSATLPPDVKRIAETRLTDPEFITLSGDHIGALSIEHYVYRSTGNKSEELIQVIDIENPESAIVFCNTRDQTKRIAGALKKQGFAADWLNADLAQNDREKVMKATREGKLRFLVCTDVAARGIDISHLTHVINADFPESTENYVHRTGRTGRAGKTGTAISMITPQDVGNLYMLRLTYKIFPVERDLPRAGELQTRKEADLVNFLYEAFSKTAVSTTDSSLARRVLSSDVAETIVAGLLRDHLGGHPSAGTKSAQDRRESLPAPVVEEGGGKKRKDKKEKTKKSADPPSKAEKPKKKKEKAAKKSDADREPQAASTPEAEEPRPKKEASKKPLTVKSSSAPSTPKAPERSEAAPQKRAVSGPAARKREASEAQESSAGLEVVSAADLLSASEQALLRGEDDAEPTRTKSSDRAPREKRSSRNENSNAEDEGRIFVDVGKRDDVFKDDLLDILADHKFPVEKVSYVNIRETHSFVVVPGELLDQAIDALDGEVLDGMEIMAEKARPPRGGPKRR